MSDAGLSLAKIESFYVGGETRKVQTSSGGTDELIIGQMYVQHMRPTHQTFPYPVVFIHGGMHTGVTWETTPAGKEGWQTLFLRGGFATYVVDQVARGRSAPDLSCLAPGLEPSGPEQAVSIVGIGIASFMSRGGTQFPQNLARDYAAQLWPDFGMIGAAQKGHPGISAPEALAPIIALLDKIGNAILVTHSQGGDLGWQVAIACPDKVAAIVAVEPARTAPGLSDPRFPDIPVRIVWGDNIPAESPVLSQSDVAEGVNIAAERPSVSVDVLPESGIFGNGHMMMMEDNNVEIAKRIMMWLRAKLP